MTVFSISLKYIRDHLFKSLSDKFSEIQKEDIHYVLTVPAIWDDNAKQFMREAAVKVSGQQLEALVLKATYIFSTCHNHGLSISVVDTRKRFLIRWIVTLF